MIALKEFRYFDFQRKESIPVAAGESIDPAVLGKNKVDCEKLVRTKHLQPETGQQYGEKISVRKKRVRAK